MKVKNYKLLLLGKSRNSAGPVDWKSSVEYKVGLSLQGRFNVGKVCGKCGWQFDLQRCIKLLSSCGGYVFGLVLQQL